MNHEQAKAEAESAYQKLQKVSEPYQAALAFYHAALVECFNTMPDDELFVFDTRAEADAVIKELTGGGQLNNFDLDTRERADGKYEVWYSDSMKAYQDSKLLRGDVKKDDDGHYIFMPSALSQYGDPCHG